MKKNKYKICVGGFTVMDVLIAMIIGGIVITMAITYFIHLQKYLSEERIKTDTDTQFNLLETALTNDFRIADQTIYHKNRLDIKTPEEIQYIFTDEYILRNTEHKKDTFPLKTKQCDVVYLSEKDNIPEAIDIMINLEKELEYRICLRKNYSARQLHRLLSGSN